jgi:hypothetical protein
VRNRTLLGLAALLIGLAVAAGCGTPVYVSGHSSSGYYGGNGWNDPHYYRPCCRSYGGYYGRRALQPPVFRGSYGGAYSIPSRSRY